MLDAGFGKKLKAFISVLFTANHMTPTGGDRNPHKDITCQNILIYGFRIGSVALGASLSTGAEIQLITVVVFLRLNNVFY